jgi:hypothetical protein
LETPQNNRRYSAPSWVEYRRLLLAALRAVLHRQGQREWLSVSLTLGNSALPFGDCFIAEIQAIGHLLLRQALFFSQAEKQGAYFAAVQF